MPSPFREPRIRGAEGGKFVKRILQKTTGGVFAYRTRAGQRWGVDFRDPTTGRRRRKRGLRSRNLALRFKDKVDRQELGLEEVKPEVEVLTFDTALGRFLEDRLARGRTLRSYPHFAVENKRGRQEGFWWSLLKGRALTSITVEEIEAALDKGTMDYSWLPATRNRALAQLSSLLSYATRRRWVENHPIDRGRIPRLPEDNARTRWLRVHEVQAIAKHSPPWLQVIVKFAVATGMRMGEICTLRKASYQTDEAGSAFVITERTKNGDRLIWPLEGWPLKYVERRVTTSAFPGDFLFPGPGGGNAYTSVHHTLPGVVRRAGLKFGRKETDGITFHTFRHSMASLALNHGVPESVVQRMGNWKTRVMVDRYAHLADETLRAGAATLAKLVSSRKKQPAKTERNGTRKKAATKVPAYDLRTLASKGSDTTRKHVLKPPAISTI
jgi:integrase